MTQIESGLVEIKGATLPVVQLQLRSLDVGALRADLDRRLGDSPDFFAGELAVADLAALDASAQPDWAGIVGLFAQRGLRLSAVANAGRLEAGARAVGLAVVRLGARRGGQRPAPAAEPVPAAAPAPTPEPAAVQPEPTREAPQAPSAVTQYTSDKPLRSGQQFYARGGDAVLLAQASAGSEVIADGSIHVYAPLRGRALAGARGDIAARIFTTCFQAQLVSVAGVYRTFEDGIPPELAGRPVQVRLAPTGAGGTRLVIEPLNID